MGEYVKISSTRVDADSPIDEDLTADLSEHGDYNYDHGLRVGEDATPVRRVIAMGGDDFSDTSPIANVRFTGTVTFSTDADDGDPNFLLGFVPNIQVSLFEDHNNGDYWQPSQLINSVHCGFWNNTYTGFDWYVQFNNTAITPDIYGYIHWVAYGKPSAGE